MATPKLKGEDDDEEQQTESEEEEVEETEETETTEGEETPEEDEEEVETEEVELPDDDDEDDDGGSKGSLLSGSTFGISNKVLLGIGIAAILLVLVLRSSDANSSTRDYSGGDEQVEEEIDEGSDGAVEKDVTDAGGSDVKFSEEAQDDAIGSIFG